MNYKTEMVEGMIRAVSDIRPGRCVGNTTRQVNDTIDLLFSLPPGKKIVGFEDHGVKDWGLRCNDHFMKLLHRRLISEGRCRVVSNLDYDSKVRQVIIGKNFIRANF